VTDVDARGERIDRLLEQVEAAVGPTTWPRVEELLATILDLYGDGLARLVAVASPELVKRLASDELLSSLLLLHGVHPVPAEDRARAAVERVNAQLAAQGVRVEIVVFERDKVRLRAEGELGESAVRLAAREIERTAPEIAVVRPEAPVQLLSADRLVRP